MEKSLIRENIIKKRSVLSQKNITLYSRNIINKIENQVFFQKSKNIAMYYPFKNEVDLLKLYDKYKSIKNFLFPKVQGKDMNFHKVNNYSDFSKGNFNIMEPKTEIFKGNIELFLIPGVAFSKKLYRIGYGGGFYDKYINKKVDDSILVGIAYDFQIFDELPIEKHDQKLHVILTNKGVYK